MFFSPKIFDSHTVESLKETLFLSRNEYAEALLEYKKESNDKYQHFYVENFSYFSNPLKIPTLAQRIINCLKCEPLDTWSIVKEVNGTRDDVESALLDLKKKGVIHAQQFGYTHIWSLNKAINTPLPRVVKPIVVPAL